MSSSKKPTASTKNKPPRPHDPSPNLTDTARTEIDTSTSLLLRDLSTSITNLSSAESLRQETATRLLRKRYGGPRTLLARWASGHDNNNEDSGKTAAQISDEGAERGLSTVREAVLWFLRRRLEIAVGVQRGMVERRIERVVEREKSVLYKAAAGSTSAGVGVGGDKERSKAFGDVDADVNVKATSIDDAEAAAIEAQLTPQQLQLFEQENDSMVRYYEDTLGKVQTAEKSLLEISSLQQTLVAHLATQEEHIDQLVADASNTQTNIGQGNRELKRAAESRSAAQAVFWGTVGLCSGLVVWDLIF
ncbi:putative SNARE protein (Ufe1) [Aspergillus candidus]|uniref:Snare protein n=1 Tax=Aspergillus candidus TaxID=41067 RepID=A0A2I2FFP7_ASPCN|nr:snare protein [Aspergillus candidus]PLB39419.1 snare protein [Aspergillus candidus]